jgi:hypothetical protein
MKLAQSFKLNMKLDIRFITVEMEWESCHNIQPDIRFITVEIECEAVTIFYVELG